jgi:energy-coupling factor transporter ATP-binding protein EcfA2
VCRDYNLSIAAGESVALVGASGCGKVSRTVFFDCCCDVESGLCSVRRAFVVRSRTTLAHVWPATHPLHVQLLIFSLSHTEHDHQPAAALLRPPIRPHLPGRARHQGSEHPLAASPDRLRGTGAHPVRRHRRGQHRLRPSS